MAVELKVPDVGESITEVQIGEWLKKEGDWVKRDEEIVDIESEKATVQVVAPESGKLVKILIPTGEFAEVGDIVGMVEAGEPADGDRDSGTSGTEEPKSESGQLSAAPAKEAKAETASTTPTASQQQTAQSGNGSEPDWVMPAAKRLLAEYGLQASDVKATGPGGRLLKEDVENYARSKSIQPEGNQESGAPPQAPQLRKTTSTTIPAPPKATVAGTPERSERVVPMSIMRRTISARLVEAQQTAALLTTFNEINMQPVMELRSKYKDAYQEKYGVKLGFMSFFTKASVEALKRFSGVNAMVDGNNIVYRDYYDVGIAIGGGKGLVVPILRNTERMSFAEIEQNIGELARRAKENDLKPADLVGGTFTISNGGIYGSLLSTPIVNPPQSGILGLHSIQERPMAVKGQVVILPMMYLALTYDHRIVDGREAVGFLRCIKEVLEEPDRLFLEI